MSHFGQFSGWGIGWTEGWGIQQVRGRMQSSAVLSLLFKVDAVVSGKSSINRCGLWGLPPCCVHYLWSSLLLPLLHAGLSRWAQPRLGLEMTPRCWWPPNLLPAQFLYSLQTHDPPLFLPFLLGCLSHLSRSESKMELPLCQALHPSEWRSDLSGCHSPKVGVPFDPFFPLWPSSSHPHTLLALFPKYLLNLSVSLPGPSLRHLLPPGSSLPVLLSLSQVIPISTSNILLSSNHM